MPSYETWVDLAPGVHDLEFVRSVRAYLDSLVQQGRMDSYRIRRRQFGFGPEALGEFNITMEFRDLTQLDEAFQRVARRDQEIESLHEAVFSKVRNYKSGLWRDFPDPVRESV